MALEKEGEEEKFRQNHSDNTKRTEKEEEELAHETLLDSLNKIQSRIQKLDRAIEFTEDNPRKLAILTNARARQQQQLFYCVALLRDPKLRLTTENGRSRDFARLIEKALLEDNPAAAKLVEEAEQKSGSTVSPKVESQRASNSLNEEEEDA